MKKVFYSFVLACFAIAASAQMNQTPFKTFDNDYYPFRVFTYKNGDQIFLKNKNYYEEGLIEFYDLSFTLTKKIDLSNIPGFVEMKNFKDKDSLDIFVSEKIFNNDDLLEFIVVTTDGWVIVNENYQEVFRKRYTENWDYCYFDFSLLETKNGNLLQVCIEGSNITGYDPEYGYPYWESSGRIEIYALPGYYANSLRSTEIQQLSNPFPNPARTFIHLPYTLPEDVKEGTIRVFNSQGQLIKTFNVDRNSEYVRFDTTRLPSGNYFYALETRGQRGEGKQFIVNK